MNHLELATVAYAYAEEHYGDKDARFDVIVECMSKAEIASELEEQGITTEPGAIAWAKRRAGLHHEQELNQAWDGPESCIGSSHYDPLRDPNRNPVSEDDEERRISEAEDRAWHERKPHIDSYTGWPIYTLTPEESAALDEGKS